MTTQRFSTHSRRCLSMCAFLLVACVLSAALAFHGMMSAVVAVGVTVAAMLVFAIKAVRTPDRARGLRPQSRAA